MSRTPAALACLAALFLPTLAPAAPIPAARPAAEMPLPGKTLVALQVQGHGRVLDRLKAMLQKAAPDVAPNLSAKIDDGLGKALEGWNLDPIKPDARAGVAFLSFEGGGTPEAVAFLPMNDFAAFKKVLPDELRRSYEKGRRFDTFEAGGDKTMYVADLTAEGYVAVATTQEAAEAAAAKEGRLNAAAMGPAAAELFLAGDVGVYVHMERINELYGERIRQFRPFFQTLLQQGMAQGGGGVDPKQGAMIREVYDHLFQAVEDSQGVALGFGFPPEGLSVKLAMAFAGDTASRKFLAGESPAEVPLLASAPAGQVSYTAGRVSPKLAAALAGFGAEFSVGEEDDDKAAGLFAAYQQLVADSKGFLAAASPPQGAFGVVSAADPAALVAAKLKAFRAMTDGMRYTNVPLKEKPVVKESAQTAHGFTLHEARLRLDFDAAVKHIPNENARDTTVASMKRLISENMNIWFGTDGKRVVQVAAKDWPAAEALLADYAAGKNGVGLSAAFQATRGLLPKEASVVSLTDVGKMIGAVGGAMADVLKTLPGLPVSDLPPLAPAPATTAYLGMALTARPDGVRMEMFVPAESAGIARTMLKPVIEAVGKKDQD